MILQQYLQDKHISCIELIIEKNETQNIENNLQHFLKLIYYQNILKTKIQTWKIYSNYNIFENNLYFKILDIFYEFKDFLNNTEIIVITKYLDDNTRMIFNMEKQLFQQYQCQLKIDFFISTPTAIIPNQSNINYYMTIDATNINNWINYYKQWKKIYKQYNIYPHIIEIKDNNWSQEALEFYTNFLIYIFFDKIKSSFFNPTIFIKKLFTNKANNILLIQDQVSSCEIQNILYLKLDNLTIVPCQYNLHKELYIGHIATDEIIENNIEIGLSLWESNFKNLPKCSHCIFTSVCAHQCFAASYNSYGEMFIPVKNTCDFQQQKIITLYKLYKKFGIIKQGKKMNLFSEAILQLFEYLEKQI